MAIYRSHNRQLRKAYYSALAGITYNGYEVPVFSEMAPDNPPACYIVFGSINNSDRSQKTDVTVDASMQVSIWSSNPAYHNANAVDAIADEVLQRITAGIEIDGFQNVGVQVVNDNMQRAVISNQLVALDRMITFRHIIFQGTS